MIFRIFNCFLENKIDQCNCAHCTEKRKQQSRAGSFWKSFIKSRF